MPKISIIVPVYNSEKSLKRCIDSILNQTYKDFELILINDGSVDSSKDIINLYKEQDSRIVVIHNENKGVSETRNIGIGIAKGEFIQFVDSDDYIEKNMLEDTLKSMEENDCDLVITGSFLNIESEDDIKTTTQTFKYENLHGKNNIAIGVLERLNGTYINSLWNKIFKREIILNNNIKMNKDINLGEDFIFNLEYLKQCNNVIFDEKCYYHYCMEAKESLTSKYRDDKLDLMELMYQKCKEYLEYCNINESDMILLNNIFIKWMYSCFIDLNNSSCKLTLKEKLKYIKKSSDKYEEVVSKTKYLGFMLTILKKSLRYPYAVWIISKCIYIIKVKFRQMLY